MATVSGKYERIPHSLLDDAAFDRVRDDLEAMGAWLILYVVAGQTWPSPAYVPSTIPTGTFAKLAEAGVVEALAGSRYRVPAMDADREMRAHSGRNAAAVRWHSGRNAEGMPTRPDQTNTRPEKSSSRTS